MQNTTSKMTRNIANKLFSASNSVIECRKRRAQCKNRKHWKLLLLPLSGENSFELFFRIRDEGKNTVVARFRCCSEFYPSFTKLRRFCAAYRIDFHGEIRDERLCVRRGEGLGEEGGQQFSISLW